MRRLIGTMLFLWLAPSSVYADASVPAHKKRGAKPHAVEPTRAVLVPLQSEPWLAACRESLTRARDELLRSDAFRGAATRLLPGRAQLEVWIDDAEKSYFTASAQALVMAGGGDDGWRWAPGSVWHRPGFVETRQSRRSALGITVLSDDLVRGEIFRTIAEPALDDCK